MTTTGGAAPEPGSADDALRLWMAAQERAEAQRDATLASDAERERVCELLSQAFGQGRLTPADLDERTSRALVARTHGDLEDVLAGLITPGSSAHWATRPRRGLVPRVVFWVVAFFTAPFVFLGSMFLLFGSDAGDRVFGTVLLVLFLPGLVALHRWAHPRG